MSEKHYSLIEMPLGSTIEDVVNKLVSLYEFDLYACFNFNGVWLYSDKVTMDSAYKAITGMTFEEFKLRYGG